jgi:hypothetical protein
MVREKIKATTVRLVRGMKRLGLLSRSIRCIERSFFYKNNYTNGPEIARRIH